MFKYLTEQRKFNSENHVGFERIREGLAWCQAQWEVFQKAMEHFYGVEYHFTRNDDYFGICKSMED